MQAVTGAALQGVALAQEEAVGFAYPLPYRSSRRPRTP
jgi:hypothetical protein